MAQTSVWGRDVQMDTGGSSFSDARRYYTVGFSRATLTPAW